MSIEAIEAVIDLIELGAMASKEDIVKCLRSAVAEAEKQVSYTGNGTAGRENMTAPTGFFFQMPKAEQDFVAWIDDSGHPKHISYCQSIEEKKLYGALRPLYTNPQPKREPLTDKQIDELWESTASYYNTHDFARAIEAAHGIKGEA